MYEMDEMDEVDEMGCRGLFFPATRVDSFLKGFKVVTSKGAAVLHKASFSIHMEWQLKSRSRQMFVPSLTLMRKRFLTRRVTVF